MEKPTLWIFIVLFTLWQKHEKVYNVQKEATINEIPVKASFNYIQAIVFAILSGSVKYCQIWFSHDVKSCGMNQTDGKDSNNLQLQLLSTTLQGSNYRHNQQ